jgi:hypothetical protein
MRQEIQARAGLNILSIKIYIKGFGISIGHSYVGQRTTLDPAINRPPISC